LPVIALRAWRRRPMTRVLVPGALALLVGILLVVFTEPSAEAQDKKGTWKVQGKNGAVAAGGNEAVEAGWTGLRDGGTAADAAVATILALSVTDSTAFCFGGEVPILVYNSQRGTVEVIGGLGRAPKLATREYFAKKGGTIPGKGIEPAAV